MMYTPDELHGVLLETYGSHPEYLNTFWVAAVNLMDDDIREQVHRELAPCTNEEFLSRYLELDKSFVNVLRSEFNLNL